MRRLLHPNKKLSDVLSTYFLIFLLLLNMVPFQSFPAHAAETNSDEPKSELAFTVVESKAPIQKPEAVKSTPTQELSPERVEELLKRLSPLKPITKASFVIPEDSLVKPKLPGIQTLEEFPPKETQREKPVVSASKAPLSVLRTSHSGIVDTVTQYAITYSQPMVPVSEARTFATVPSLVMKPQPSGKYRWAGTQTLLFDPERGRFPKSTEYKITVPAGTESAIGGQSVKEQSWTMTTPTVVVKNFYPQGGPQVQSPIMVAVFDQDIDRKAVLKNMRLTVGKDNFGIRLVDDAKVESDSTRKYWITNVPKNQWLAFESESPLPLGTKAKVSFLPGTPSLEGPLKTTSAQEFNVDIHGVFRLVRSPEQGVSPERWSSRSFEFSNPIDTSPAKFKPAMVKVTPSVPMEIQASGSYISIQGRLKPFTKYTVTFDKDITDTFGQSLERQVIGTFTTGALNTQLSQLEVLNTIPYGQKPIISGYAQAVSSVKATIYRTTPKDWLTYSQDRYNRNLHVGTMVGTKSYKIGNEDATFEIDLKPYLKNGLGQFVVELETVGAPRDREQRFMSWVQVTKLGVDAFKGRNLIAVASSLADGTPVAGVDLTLLTSNVNGVTDANGMAKLAISTDYEKSEVLVARQGDDVAILPASQYRSGWVYNDQPNDLLWYTVTDRQLYKPGEKVTVKGWARGLHFKPNDALQLFTPKIETVSYAISGYDGKELVKGETSVDATGGFSFETTLPEKVNLGNANIMITAHGKQEIAYPGSQSPVSLENYISSGNLTTSVLIKIQEFRRPEFEMKVASSLGNSMLIGDTTSLTAKTQYYAGGVLQDAPISWSVAASESSYSPPGWSEFTFGKVQPFWFRGEGIMSHRGGFYPRPVVSEVKTLSSTTDATGTHTVNVKFDSFKEPYPMSASCEATVNDVNRQSWSDKVSVLVHSADTYVGVKPGKWFYHKGEAVDLRYIATDIDGKVKPGSRVVFKLVKNDRDGKEVEVTRQTVSSGEQAEQIKLMPKEGGQHYVVATVFDGKERRNRTRISTWIEGDLPAEARKAQIQTLMLIPDRKEYQPGDTAEIMVSTPFYPAHGIVTVRRNSIVSTIPLEMTTSSKSIKIPVTKDYYPNFSVEAYLTGKDSAFASGTIEMKVPPRARTLALQALAAQKDLSPGGDTSIEIDLKGADGKPVKNAQVALAVADDAVLALAGYKWPDPIELFYPVAQSAVENAYSRQYVILPAQLDENGQQKTKQRADAPVPPASAPMMFRAVGGMAKKEAMMDGLASRDSRAMANESSAEMGQAAEPEPNIAVRTNFSALALFVPSIVTDENGKAKVKLHLPDSLTRYRIMAVAVAGDDAFGSTESNVTARLPLMVKPSAPRFLHFGDRCELPVVLQNQTDKPLKVEVVMRASNAQLKDVSKTRSYDRMPPQTYDTGSDKIDGTTTAPDGSASSSKSDSPDSRTGARPASSDGSKPEGSESAGKVVDVPANDRVEVRFPVATIDEGNANFQCAAVSGAMTDAAEFTVPVLVPATMETFATYGQIDKGAIQQKIDRPKDVFEQVGGLTITTSSTAVQALTDAYFYLKNYHYGCSEQISSRMIAMLSLQDVLVAFGKLGGAEQSEFKEFVKKDIAELVKRQNPDGSFGLWKTGERDKWPYVSIQVAQALNLATQKDYLVDKQILDRSEQYLKNIAAHIPKEYDERTKIAIEARALNVRFRMGDIDSSAARRLVRRALNPKTKPSSKNPPPSNPPRPLAKIAPDRVSNTSDLSLDCAGWLLPILSKDKDSSAEVELIRKQFDASIKETASTASANESGYGDWNYCLFYSPRRTDAIVLEALMIDQPESELIPKMVKGLLAHRKNGTWEGTQENGYILQALDRYFGTYEKQKPDFESKEWLGETLVGLQKFAGRTTETKIVSIPTSYLAKRNDSDIVVSKDGPGRLYYRIGLDYAPRNLTLKPADFGFSVERTYEGVDNKDDVKKDADGVWHIKAGSTVKTKLKFTTPGARYHVAMMDPLPAGAEPLNPDLSGSRTQVPDNGSSGPTGGLHIQSKFVEAPFFWWWPRQWFEHQNLRDHQAEAFQSLLFAGSYDYTYMIRATTPGDYNVPPTKLEEMYMSETFGRCASDHVIIE